MSERSAPDIAEWKPLAYKIAGEHADGDMELLEDLAQTALLALLKAFEKNPPEDLQKPGAFVTVTLRRAVRRYLQMEQRRTATLQRRPPQPSSVSPDPVPEVLALEEYLEELREACGERCRFIAESLIHPGEVIGVHVLREQRRKKEVRRRRPSVHNQIHTIRVTPQMMRRALGLNTREITDAMEEIREFTYDWLERHGESLPAWSP